jgi:hypothetical protein
LLPFNDNKTVVTKGDEVRCKFGDVSKMFCVDMFSVIKKKCRLDRILFAGIV